MAHIIANVKTISVDGSLIAQSNKAPSNGDVASDSQKRQIGKVVSIFGPVEGPYITIKPSGNKANLHHLIGEQIFLSKKGGMENGLWRQQKQRSRKRYSR